MCACARAQERARRDVAETTHDAPFDPLRKRTARGAFSPARCTTSPREREGGVCGASATRRRRRRRRRRDDGCGERSARPGVCGGRGPRIRSGVVCRARECETRLAAQCARKSWREGRDRSPSFVVVFAGDALLSSDERLCSAQRVPPPRSAREAAIDDDERREYGAVGASSSDSFPVVDTAR